MESEANHFPSPESCVMDHNYQDMTYDSVSQSQQFQRQSEQMQQHHQVHNLHVSPPAPPIKQPSPDVRIRTNKILTTQVFNVEANIGNSKTTRVSPLKHSNKVEDFKTNTTSDFFKIDTKMNSTDAYNLFMK